MESVFINVSNHPSSDWRPNQLSEAKLIGAIYDIPFPIISPDWDTEEVALLVDVYRKKIKEILHVPDGKSVVHVMGEAVFTLMLVSSLIADGYTVVASTTERIVHYKENERVSVFEFVRFREYRIKS